MTIKQRYLQLVEEQNKLKESLEMRYPIPTTESSTVRIMSREGVGKHAMELLQEEEEQVIIPTGRLSEAKIVSDEVNRPVSTAHEHEKPQRKPRNLLLAVSSHDVGSGIKAIDRLLANRIFLPYFDRLILLHAVEKGEEVQILDSFLKFILKSSSYHGYSLSLSWIGIARKSPKQW